MSPLLEGRGLSRSFTVRGSGWLGRRYRLSAVREVDLTVDAEECVAVVGESGSGKTTLGRVLVRLLEPDAGSLRFGGEDLLALSGAALRRRRADFQMVFQDAAAALDPRQTVASAITEPLRIHRRIDRRGESLSTWTREALAAVGLGEALLDRYPHELSGGQRQRVGLARALGGEPRLLVLDEPVSALDATIKAQILALLEETRAKRRLAMVLISHDLTVVEHLADRVMILYLGRVVEHGGRAEIFSRPLHPYTATLLAAAPVPEVGRRPITVRGEVPSPLEPPPGCPFHPRCPFADSRCRTERPSLDEVEEGRFVACHHPEGVGEFSAMRMEML